jgi:hypothetical protein
MKQKLLIPSMFTLGVLILAACGGTSTTLTSITIAGANDATIDFDSTFNFKTGVTATGNDGVSYTSSITLQSSSDAVNLETGALDTTSTGVHAVRYNVVASGITSQRWRYITVSEPVSTGGMLINPDFSLGTAGWDSVGYNADGSALTLSIQEGSLKAEVTAGSVHPYTPRFGQMNVPFEIDTTYEVSFRAKSLVEKDIRLQVGELLPDAPYYNDFIPGQTIIRKITTEWATYSYKFTHRLDNQRGGILFELGKVNGAQINTTMYFDDIAIEESTADEDTVAPVFTGVQTTVNLTVGSSYNPLTGVTAFDVGDGDVTEDIVVVIKNAQDAVVNAVVTSVAGTFTVEYSVEDSKGNEATAESAVTVVDLLFKNENLFTNGSFATAIGEEWSFYTRDWAPVPVVNRSQDVAAGTYSLNITGGDEASWNIQMNHAGAPLVEGQTYRLSFTGYASVARSFSAAFENPAPNNVNYGRKNGFEFGTTSSTTDFVFTVTQPTETVRLTIELGAQAGFADGIVTFEEVRLQRLDGAPIIANSDFSNSGWRGYGETGNTNVTSEIVNGEFKMTVNEYAPYPQSWDPGATASSFHLQIVQDAESLAGLPGTSTFLDLAPSTTYELKFDAYATEAVTLTPNLFSQEIFTNYVQSPATTLTTSKTTFTLSVVTPATLNDTEKLAFEFGKGITAIENGGTPISVYLDNITLKTGGVDVPTLYNGDMETALGGHSFFTDTGGSAKVTSEGLSVVVPTLGGAPHTPHYFYMIPSLSAGTYQVKIALTSSVARDLRFNIVLPDAGYNSILTGGFIDQAVTTNGVQYFTATIVLATGVTNAKVELDFGTLGGTKTSLPGTFVIQEVLLYRNYNA